MIWRQYYHVRLAQIVDFFTVVICLYISNHFTGTLYNILPVFGKEFVLLPEHYLLIFFLGLFIVYLFKKQNAYNYLRFTSLITEYLIILKVTTILIVISIILIFMFRIHFPRTTIILFFGLLIILFVVQKTIVYKLAANVRKKGKNPKRILIVGIGEKTKHFINTVSQNLNWGLDIVGLLNENNDDLDQEYLGVKIIGTYSEIEQVLATINPEEVIITFSSDQFYKIKFVLNVCEREGVQVRLISDFYGYITKKVVIDSVYGLDIVSFLMTHHSEMEIIFKRLMDIIGSIIALILFSPFMIVAAIGIWITDGRPILYKWNVVGLNKKPFSSWKFRTMVKDADKLKEKLMEKNEMSEPVFKIKNDPRIIPFGRWMRKWSIDETPQLFSVLKGDMSLVGPRPAGPHELARYESWHRRKLSVKPGITCLWQAYGRNEINNFDDWVRMDLEYIDNWTIGLDIKILLKTIPAVLKGRGAS
jgi:exopolysaccharide biosynthesis polyprenyl glycosylphosphotransferase